MRGVRQVGSRVTVLLYLLLLTSYLLFLIEGVIIAWKLLMMTGLLLLGPAVRSVQDQDQDQDHEVWAECDRQVGGKGGCAVTVYLCRFP